VKTRKFSSPVYVGDPINAIKIFNDKEVDELIFLDIDATKTDREPNLKLIEEIAGECFMPLSYGGGIKSIKHIESILKLGVEKVIINSYAMENPNFIKEAAKIFGSSTIVVSIDYKNDLFGNSYVYTNSGTKKNKIKPIHHCKIVEEMGAGEIMLNSIARDGQMKGFDIELLKEAVASVSIPVICCGGAGSLADVKKVVDETSVAAVAAGSIFVFHGPHNAVLINYPNQKELKNILK
jgi:cyclase